MPAPDSTAPVAFDWEAEKAMVEQYVEQARAHDTNKPVAYSLDRDYSHLLICKITLKKKLILQYCILQSK